MVPSKTKDSSLTHSHPAFPRQNIGAIGKFLNLGSVVSAVCGTKLDEA